MMQVLPWHISLLYVEDEKILRSVYERILRPKVATLLMADNGEEGFQKYQEYQPDLILTDIKMPVMNGLDMIRKIRKLNPNARVIIMSAYGESHYFMRAIENGVKSFLPKPVDNDKLLAVISEQVREIQLERDVKSEEQKRKKAERELRNNEHILQAVSDIAEILLQLPFETDTLNKVFAKLGAATGVSRVYFFELFTEDEEKFCKQTIEWVAEGIEPQIGNEELQKVPVYGTSFERWAGILENKQVVYGLIRNFPENEQEVLVPQGILSVLAVPVFIDDVWEGFIGFDDCEEERNWSIAEMNTLQVAANIMGAAGKRNRIERQLKELNAELEQRVSQRTIQLQEEIKERIQTEELLRDSEEKYRLIFENANDGIFISMKGYIQFVNPKTCEITGYLPKLLIGKPLTDFLHPDFREMVLDVHYKKRLRSNNNSKLFIFAS
jgi:CheY-like chemotaxis protein